MINANYLPDEAVDDRMKTVLEEGDWVLLELTPVKIISINQRGGM